MNIVTIINVHTDPELVQHTIGSVKKWVTDKIVVVVDQRNWDAFKNFPFQNIDLIKGAFNAPPYKNIAIGMNYAYAKYPNADWYNYIEYDVLYLNDFFKEDLIKRSNCANLGFCHCIAGCQTDGDLPRKILNKPELQAEYMLGAVNFYSNNCVQQLMSFDFFNEVLNQTNNGYNFPNFGHVTVEEIIYPTAAGAFGPVDNLTDYANPLKISGYGSTCERYAVRYIPNIELDDVTPLTSIIHPSKNLNCPIRQQHIDFLC
ncbi:MAG: hypothetical protein M0R80_02290 [Proteobacteria bacterium]|jgi:hypothetical protein|nr:hypothetical protein [Pseudomonadota bacterium]